MASFAELVKQAKGEQPSVQQTEEPASFASMVSQAKGEAPQAVQQTQQVDPDSMGSTIGRAADQLQSTFGGAVETLGEITDSEYLQEAGAQFREEQLAQAAEYGTPTISSYKQVDFENPDQVGEYLKQMGLSAIPGTGAVLAAGGAGAKAGSFAGPKGAVVGGILGALSAALPINIGEVQNAIKEIDPEAKSPWSSVIGGAAISTLDMAGLTSIAKPLIKTLGKDLAVQALREQGVVKEAAIQAVKGAVGESATEAAQEGVKAVAAAEGTDTAINTEKLIEDAINGAVGGGLIGGGAGGMSGGIAANEQNQYVAGTAAPSAIFEEGRTAPLNIAQRAWDALGSESTSLIEPLARNSESIKGIVRSLRPDMTGETASAPTVFEDHEMMVGKWRTALEEGLRGQDVDAAVEDYVQGGTSQGANAIRNVLKDVLDTARTEGGLKIGQVQDYLPTRLDKDAIVADSQGFLNDISPYLTNPQAALQSWLEEQSVDRGNTVPKVDRALTQDPLTGKWTAPSQYQRKGDPESFRYKFAQGTVPPEFGHLEKSRSFAKVPQKVLQKWTKEQDGVDVMNAVKDYFEGAAHRIAYAKEFGPSGEKLNYKIVKGVKEAQAKGYTPKKTEVDRIYDLMDAYNGMYNRIETEGLKNLQSVGMAALTMKTLPLSLLSSFTEILNPAIRGDVKAAIIALAPTIAQVAHDVVRNQLKFIPRTEFSVFASNANITLGAAMSTASERLGTNAFNRGSATWLRRFFLANGLTWWTHFTSVYSAKTADRIFQENIFELARGVPITSPKGANMANQLRSLGVPVYTNEDAQVIFNPTTASQREAAKQYRTLAIRRFKDQTVLQPNIADTPMWMSNGHLQWLAMVKRYPAAYGNIILPQLVRKFRPSWAGSRTQALKGAAGTMFIVGAILFVGYLQDELKMWAKGTKETDKRTEGQRAVDVLNSTMAPLQVSLMTDFVAAPRYGSSGPEAVAGPVIGTIGETVKTINTVYDNPTEGEVWKYLYKQTPFGFSRPGREAAGEFEIFD